MDKYLELFDKMIMGYEKSEELKKHSLSVSENARKIAESLINLSDDEIMFSCILGLFHDVGKTLQGRDHAGDSVALLFDKYQFNNYLKTDRYIEIMKDAIYYHNKLELPDYLDDDIKLFSKILRDADKLDIYNNSLNDDYHIVEYPSKEVYDVFVNYKCIDINNCKNDTDKLLMLFSFVFDINYKYSFTVIKDNEYYNKIYNKLGITDSNLNQFIGKIIEVLNKYIERKIGE